MRLTLKQVEEIEGLIILVWNRINQPNMTEYLKIVPLPFWWQKLELKDLSISELFEEPLSWNLESKLITPKYITGTYFGAIVFLFFQFDFCV